MVLGNSIRRILAIAVSAGCFVSIEIAIGQESENGSSVQQTKQITEPVFRVSKLIGNDKPTETTPVGADAHERVASGTGDAALASPMTSPSSPTASEAVASPHPLDAAIDMAHEGLRGMQSNIFDYTATLVKRERVNDKLCEHEFMKIKIRNARIVDGQVIPFSIYMKFLKPKSVAGREVIWVDGRNDGKILAHEAGVITGFKTFYLDPNGWLAMQNNRHPIYEAGLENLVRKLIEKAERDRDAGQCKVEYRKGAKINGRVCTMISVTHDEQKHPYDFHNAQVFIDDELQIPIRYASYDWPTTPGEKGVLTEEYTYVDVALNVGLTDNDFDPANAEYSFPGYRP